MKRILIFIVVLTAASLISGVANSKVKGTISGQVTDPSGNGIPNVYINVYDYNNNYWIKGSSTDSDGNYSLKVPAGTYKVRFSQPPSDGYYAPQWYDNKSNSVAADLVTVKGFRTTTNIDAQLAIGGTISGRVTDASGNGYSQSFMLALVTFMATGCLAPLLTIMEITASICQQGLTRYILAHHPLVDIMHRSGMTISVILR